MNRVYTERFIYRYILSSTNTNLSLTLVLVKKYFFLHHLFMAFIHLSICLSIYLSVCLSIYLSIYLSICLSVCLSIYLSIYLYIDKHTRHTTHQCKDIKLLYDTLHNAGAQNVQIAQLKVKYIEFKD